MHQKPVILLGAAPPSPSPNQTCFFAWRNSKVQMYVVVFFETKCPCYDGGEKTFFFICTARRKRTKELVVVPLTLSPPRFPIFGAFYVPRNFFLRLLEENIVR